jgi:hypothetical protein
VPFALSNNILFTHKKMLAISFFLSFFFIFFYFL